MLEGVAGPNRALADDGWCFVCGPENPRGLRLSWSLDDDGVARARFTPDRWHQGWNGILHGGIVAALLDEAMAQCSHLSGRPTVTASLEIRFRRPAPTCGTLIAQARVVAERGRTVRLEGSVRDESGEVCYAEGQGTCMRIDASETME